MYGLVFDGLGIAADSETLLFAFSLFDSLRLALVRGSSRPCGDKQAMGRFAEGEETHACE